MNGEPGSRLTSSVSMASMPVAAVSAAQPVESAVKLKGPAWPVLQVVTGTPHTFTMPDELVLPTASAQVLPFAV